MKDTRMNPEEIIQEYHKKPEPQQKLCKKCNRSEMKNTGIRTSASVNYIVWKCPKCNNEELVFQGLDKNAEQIIDKTLDA
jgi:RNase P subunit RPR2